MTASLELVRGGQVEVAGRRSRPQSDVSRGLQLIHSTVSGAYKLVEGTVAKLSANAVDTARETSLASIANAQESQSHVTRIALTALQNGQTHQEVLVSIIAKLQEANKELVESFQREKENDYKMARKTLILEIETARHGFQQILDHPDQAIPIAERSVAVLNRLIGGLKQELKEEAKKVKRAAREQLEQATHNSRLARISLAQKSIQETVFSLEKEKEGKVQLLFLFSIAPFALAYFFNKEVAALASLIGIGLAYRTYSSFQESNAKKKWMEIYTQALDRLKSNPHLTVLQAVEAQIQGDLSIGKEFLESSVAKKILQGLSKEKVLGDPNEQKPTIPLELAILIEHAKQPAQHFLQKANLKPV